MDIVVSLLLPVLRFSNVIWMIISLNVICTVRMLGNHSTIHLVFVLTVVVTRVRIELKEACWICSATLLSSFLCLNLS